MVGKLVTQEYLLQSNMNSFTKPSLNRTFNTINEYIKFVD